jgi:hypothetical protein
VAAGMLAIDSVSTTIEGNGETDSAGGVSVKKSTASVDSGFTDFTPGSVDSGPQAATKINASNKEIIILTGYIVIDPYSYNIITSTCAIVMTSGAVNWFRYLGVISYG